MNNNGSQQEGGNQVMPIVGKHRKGCTCKNSMCFQLYCECYKVGYLIYIVYDFSSCLILFTFPQLIIFCHTQLFMFIEFNMHTRMLSLLYMAKKNVVYESTLSNYVLSCEV